MKPKVYVETSVVSYLTAWPSRDVVTLGNQVATREWWREAARRFELVVSPLVIEESSVGNPEAARARLAALESVHVIGAGDDAIALGQVLVAAHAFPAEAAADAAHAAIAAVNGADYLVTWKHEASRESGCRGTHRAGVQGCWSRAPCHLYAKPAHGDGA